MKVSKCGKITVVEGEINPVATYILKYKNSEKIREDLHKMIKGKNRLIINHLLVEFGKEYRTNRYPKCKICSVLKLCSYENKNI